MLNPLKRFFKSEKYDPKQLATLSQKLLMVDSQDCFLDYIDKHTAHKLDYINSTEAYPHRAFSLFVFNSENKLLMQQRSHKKLTFPLHWSNTCCGHPLKGQNSEEVKQEALDRALQELGVKFDTSCITFLGKILYKAPADDYWGEFEVDYLYFVRDNRFKYISQLPINSEECESAEWLQRDKLQDYVKSHDKLVTPWFYQLVTQTDFGEWWDKFAQGTLEPASENCEVMSLIKDS